MLKIEGWVCNESHPDLRKYFKYPIDECNIEDIKYELCCERFDFDEMEWEFVGNRCVIESMKIDDKLCKEYKGVALDKVNEILEDVLDFDIMHKNKYYSLNELDKIIEIAGEVIETIPGNLIDDMLFNLGDKTYAAFEVARSEWVSKYNIVSGDNVFEVWQKRYEEYIDYLKEIGDYETLEMEI